MFAGLSARGVQINSMRNKTNRLEELFVALLHENKAQEVAA